jgi:hypothetical protein
MHIDLLKVVIGVLIWVGAQKSLILISESCIKPNLSETDPKKREISTMGIEILIIIAVITIIHKIY